MSLILEADRLVLRDDGYVPTEQPHIVVERSGGINAPYQAHDSWSPGIVVGGETPEDAMQNLERVLRMRQREEQKALRARLEARRTTAYDRAYPKEQ